MVSISQQPRADPYPEPVQLLADPRHYPSADAPGAVATHARTEPDSAPYFLTEPGMGLPSRPP